MSFHNEHCFQCFSSQCNEKSCGIIKCNYCKVKLHECKLENHQQELCGKAFVPCTNHLYGCTKILRRDKIASHIQNCVASVVVCSCMWSRNLVVPSSKRELKKDGKKLQIQELDLNSSNIRNVPLDLQLAFSDQHVITREYRTTRNFRVKQRDKINFVNTLFPLREISGEPKYDDLNEGLNIDQDSSDDEDRKKKEKLKKSELVFAHCYMCQIDPSAQHFHTLGNGGETKLLKKKQNYPIVANQFFIDHDLKIRLHGDYTQCDFVSKKTSYKFRCCETIRRSEYSGHISQHMLTSEYLESIVVRCPNWNNGCEFVDSRLDFPGEFKVMLNSSLITHIAAHNSFPASPAPCSTSNLTLETLPCWVFELLMKYLPSSALSNLSKTSKNLRANVFIGCREKCYTEPQWVKNNESGKWELKNFALKTSLSEQPPSFTWRAPNKLNEHIQKCPYFDPSTYNTSQALESFEKLKQEMHVELVERASR